MSGKLNKSDWQFRRVKEDDLRAAWMWELHRAAGSGSKPWLTLRAVDRAKVRRYLDMDYTIQDVPLNGMAAAARAFDGMTEQVHALRINWGVGRARVVKALTAWAEGIAPTIPGEGKYKPKGRQNDFRAWLGDLAIWRAYNCGMKGAAVRALMGAGDSRDSKMSDQHLRGACKKTEARLAKLIHPFPGTDFFQICGCVK